MCGDDTEDTAEGDAPVDTTDGVVGGGEGNEASADDEKANEDDDDDGGDDGEKTPAIEE